MRSYGVVYKIIDLKARSCFYRYMKKHATLLLLLFLYFISFSVFAETDVSYTLTQCYQHALKRSDSIAQNTELIYQAEERIKQARGNFFPTLSVKASYLRQEVPPPTSAIATDITPADQTIASVTATQNLFRGFRDLASLKQRTGEEKASEALREQAKLQLFQDTLDAFYTVRTYECDILNYQNEIEANQQRKQELLNLKRLARAREADIVSVDSAIASLEAALESTYGLLDASRETLAFLTGLPTEIKLNDVESYPQELLPAESWITDIDKRPDIIQLQEELVIAEKRIEFTKSGHFPVLDAGADYYFKRPGIYDDINWDVFITINVPIFSGGITQSQIREATSAKREAAIKVSERKKQREYDVRSLYRTLVRIRSQVSKLAKASELSNKRYDLLIKDNRAGLATNIDVLQALATAYQTKRSYDHAQLAAKQSYLKLEVISAIRDLKKLEEGASL